jgi:hypothetical protein
MTPPPAASRPALLTPLHVGGALRLKRSIPSSMEGTLE